MDSEDETLLNRLNRKMELKPLQFEVMVDRLEKASANQVTEPTLSRVETPRLPPCRALKCLTPGRLSPRRSW